MHLTYLEELISESGIEVTPEMIAAGAEIVWGDMGDVIPYGSSTGQELALKVYLAMSKMGKPVR